MPIIGTHWMIERSKAICNADRPREKFHDLLDEWYCDSEWDYAEEIVKKVLDDETVTELARASGCG